MELTFINLSLGILVGFSPVALVLLARILKVLTEIRDASRKVEAVRVP